MNPPAASTKVKDPSLPSTSPDFNAHRFANLARLFADNALGHKANERVIEQIILTRQIERNA